MKAISQSRRFGLLAVSALVVTGAFVWIAIGAAPVRADSGASAPRVVQDKQSESLNLKLLMHRFGTTEPLRP